MSRTIEIVVSPTGETRLQTKGFIGSSCQNASRAMEAALGIQLATERTPEFFSEAAREKPLTNRS